MGYLLAAIRAIVLFLTLSIYLLVYLIGSLLLDEERLLDGLKQSWCKLALKILGVKVHFSGEKLPYTSPQSFLAISNHRSLIDPVIILAYLNVRPLSKAEVADYPLIGYAAKKIGVIFVVRESKKSRKSVINVIKKSLINGKSVLVFPEGTTSSVETTLMFKGGSFMAAAEVTAPILPLTIHYINSYSYWVGNSMTNQYFRHLKHWKSEVYFNVSDFQHNSVDNLKIDVYRERINRNITRFRNKSKQ